MSMNKAKQEYAAASKIHNVLAKFPPNAQARIQAIVADSLKELDQPINLVPSAEDRTGELFAESTVGQAE